ncbi:lipopolysaccharide biosynthesis protein [Methylomagnum sp.]
MTVKSIAADAPVDLSGERRDLKRKAFGSILWTLARVGSDQVFSFLVFAILARRLTPHDMGLFALALACAELGKLVATAGFPEAIIRDDNPDRELTDTLFWANLLFSLAVAALLYGAAEPIAGFFQEPGLTPILRATAFIVPIAALGGVHTACKLREFGHKSMAARSVASGLIGGGLGVYLAFTGWGVWSLVAQRAAMETVSTLLAWGAYPWLPRLNVSFNRLGRVLKFSANMMINQVIWFAMVRSQDVVVGRVMTAASVGVYRVSWRAVDLTTQFAIGPFGTAALPFFARLAGDRVAFANAYTRLLAAMALVAFPAMLGLGAVADDLVPWVFGGQWTEAGKIARILSLLAVPTVLNALFSPALAALGKSGTIASVASIQLAATVGFMLVTAPFGLEAVAAAYVLRAYLLFPLQLLLLRRAAGVRIRAVIKSIFLPLLAALVMAGAILAAAPELRLSLGSGVEYLAVAVVGGAGIYILVLMVLGGPYFMNQIRALRTILKK